MYRLYRHSSQKQTLTAENLLPAEYLYKKPRKVAKQNAVRSTHIAYSAIMNRAAAFESTLERDFFLLTEFEADVELIDSQPPSFEYIINDKKRRYTADFLVVKNGVKQLIEVKYKKDTLSHEFKSKAEVLTAFFNKLNIKFFVVTEESIRVGARAKNIEMLITRMKLPPPTEQFKVLQSLLPTANMSVSELNKFLLDHHIDPSLISRAVAHGMIKCDLTKKWKEAKLFW